MRDFELPRWGRRIEDLQQLIRTQAQAREVDPNTATIRLLALSQLARDRRRTAHPTRRWDDPH